MIKRYISNHFCHICRMLHYLIFFLLLQKFKHTLCCRCHRLHLIGYLCDLLDRLRKTLHILDKCLDITDGDHTTNGQHTAAECNCRIPKISDKLHDRHHNSGKELRFPCRSIQYIICPVKLSDHFIFFVVSFNDQMTTIAFFYLSIDMSQVLLLCNKMLLGFFHHQRNTQSRNRQYHQRDQCHQRRNTEHHHQHTDDGGRRCNDLGHTLV